MCSLLSRYSCACAATLSARAQKNRDTERKDIDGPLVELDRDEQRIVIGFFCFSYCVSVENQKTDLYANRL